MSCQDTWVRSCDLPVPQRALERAELFTKQVNIRQAAPIPTLQMTMFSSHSAQDYGGSERKIAKAS